MLVHARTATLERVSFCLGLTQLPRLRVTMEEDTVLDRCAQSVPWIHNSVARARAAERKARSAFSPVLINLYRINCLRELCIRVCTRLEQGPFHSKTLRALLKQYHGVEIGPYSYGSILQPGSLPPGTTVGAYCSVGAGIIVRRRNHPLERLCQHPFFYNSGLGYLSADTIPAVAGNPLTVGHDVWIGDRVTVVSGCRRIGNGAIVAAGAVVSRDVEPYSIVGGVPARVMRRRFDDEMIERIEASRWWDLRLDELLRFRRHLLTEPTFEVLDRIARRDWPKDDL